MEFITQFQSVPLDVRKTKSERFTSKYTDRKPIVLDRHSAQSPLVEEHRYLVPNDLTLGQFMYVFRKSMPQLKSGEALTIFTEKRELPITSSTIAELYRNHANCDGFLYLVYDREHAFGSGSESVRVSD